MDNEKGILFAPKLQQSLKEQFYYADRDPAGAEQLFFDNSGGSLRLKAALEAKTRIEQLPDCPERTHRQAQELNRMVQGGTREILSCVFGTEEIPGLRHIPGVQVFADAMDLSRRDLIAAIGINGMDVTDAVAEYETRGVIVCDRSNRSMYAKRIVEALGLTGAIRVSPMHCHSTADIDRFLSITAEITGCRKA